MNLRRSLENLFRGQAVLLTTRSKDDPKMAVPVTSDDPLPVVLAGGSAGSTGSTDPDSAREATLQQVRDAVQALAPLLGNTDTLEALAATNRDLLQNIGTYTDGLEGLLSLLNTNTDGIESLLSALGVNDQNVIGKLEALRVLSESTNTHMQAANGNTFILANQAQGDGIKTQLPAGAATQATLAQVLTALQGTLNTSVTPPVSTRTALTIAAGTSLSTSTNLSGRSLIRLTIGASWTAADLTVQLSADGVTWSDLYDEYGTPYTLKAAANRVVFITPGPLLAVNWLRLRSGSPSAPVNQTSDATVAVQSVAL